MELYLTVILREDRTLDRTNQARSAELVMTTSYPASPIRIFVLLKILPNVVENLKKKKRKESHLRENRKIGIMF